MVNEIDRYAVFGCPINHSLSPSIHHEFAKQTRQEINYRAMEVKPADFNQALSDFFTSGGKGVNCTVPLKEMAFEQVDVLSDRAAFSGAVNTVKLMEDGRLYGDNTDGVGLLKDLTSNLAVILKGKRILVLGAGGATRGILGPLLESGLASLCLVNRTIAKAQVLQTTFASLGEIGVLNYSDLAGRHFDLVINATSASLSGELPPLPDGLLADRAVCYDLAYSDKPTAFMDWGNKQGAAVSVDGVGMLVEQAAQAFYLWRGIMPVTSAVLQKLMSVR